MEVKMQNAKQEKKPTAAQLASRIRNAVLFVPKDKDTQEIFFDDKWLRLTVTSDMCIIATGAHRHVFDAVTGSGISRPYLYTKRFVEIALANNCTVKDEKGNITRSYAKLMRILKEKEDKTEYNIAWYCDKWFFLIFSNLYDISETEVGTWIVYFKYLCSMSITSILLDEHKEDVTRSKFVEKFKTFLDENLVSEEDPVILRALTDEERIAQEIDALQEDSFENS